MLELGQDLHTDIARAVCDSKLSSGLACPEMMFSIAGTGSWSRRAAPMPSAFTSSRRRRRSWPSAIGGAQAAKASADRGHFRGLVHPADLLEAGTGSSEWKSSW